MSEFDIKEELKKLPHRPGVYIMRDEEDTIMYVGKAVDLHNRVRSYFAERIRGRGPQITQMVALVARFEYIVVDSEMEALILENNLIKENRPRYNTLLKDDKTYPFIRVTLHEDFPRVQFSRLMKKDKCRYFGPYPSAQAVRETIDLVNKLFGLRTCNRNLPRDIDKERPCLNYHMGMCSAPCASGYVSEEEYRLGVSKALKLLDGDDKEITKELRTKMETASENLEFEQAAKYRDLLEALAVVHQKQKMTDADMDDRDIIAIATVADLADAEPGSETKDPAGTRKEADEKRDTKENTAAERNQETLVSGQIVDPADSYAQVGDTMVDNAVVQVYFVRGGKIIGREHFFMRVKETEIDVLSEFIKQYYSGTPFIPRELFLPRQLEDQALIEEWLTERRGKRVYIRVPERGKKEKLMELASQNARIVLAQDKERLKREEGRTIGAVREIARLLRMDELDRMEAYDISNISGFANVGSMVVYEKGKPKKSDYRKFRIKSVAGPDDYACMHEVLTRRFQHGLNEKEELIEQGGDERFGSFTRFPDLILMDGGKGQVGIALKVLRELGLNIPVCGMVKDDHHRTRGLYWQNEEIPIDTHSEAFHLITRIQDEAHRFAITYHKSLRGKSQVSSLLDEIPGIGPARRKALMQYFESLQEIRDADVETLMKVQGIHQKEAETVYNYFRDAQQKEANHQE